MKHFFVMLLFRYYNRCFIYCCNYSAKRGGVVTSCYTSAYVRVLVKLGLFFILIVTLDSLVRDPYIVVVNIYVSLYCIRS